MIGNARSKLLFRNDLRHTLYHPLLVFVPTASAKNKVAVGGYQGLELASPMCSKGNSLDVKASPISRISHEVWKGSDGPKADSC